MLLHGRGQGFSRRPIVAAGNESPQLWRAALTTRPAVRVGSPEQSACAERERKNLRLGQRGRGDRGGAARAASKGGGDGGSCSSGESFFSLGFFLCFSEVRRRGRERTSFLPAASVQLKGGGGGRGLPAGGAICIP